MLRLSLITAVLFLIAADAPPRNAVLTTGKHAWLTQHPTIQRLHELQNAERQRAGMPPLTLDAEMCLIAQRHAQWMAASGAFQHQTGWRENIHQQVRLPDDAIQGWVASPGHRANMLSGTTACGFGYDRGPFGSRWVTIFR